VSDIFVSHVEEDSTIALQVAQGLEKAGYSTWYYERDSLPGVSYLLQTRQAVEQSRAVIVIVSRNSLGSRQVTNEVVRAHESGKYFIPVLHDVSHIEFQRSQPEWAEAIGAAASVSIGPAGPSAILPRILEGLRALGIEPRGKPQVVLPGQAPALGAERTVSEPVSVVRLAAEPAVSNWLRIVVTAAGVVVILIVLAKVIWPRIRSNVQPVPTEVARAPQTPLPTRAPTLAPTQMRAAPATSAPPKTTALPTAKVPTAMATLGPTPATIVAGEVISVPDALVGQFFSPGPRPEALAVVTDTLWVADREQRRLYQLTRSGGVIASMPITPTVYMQGLVWDGEALRGAYAREGKSSILRFNRDGTVSDSFEVPTLIQEGMAWDPGGDTLWICEHPDFLLQFSSEGRLLQTLKCSGCVGANGMAWAPDGLWVLSFTGDWSRVSLEGQVPQRGDLGIVSSSSDTYPFSWDEHGYLWAAVPGDTVIYQWSLKDAVVQPTPTPNATNRLALPTPEFKPLPGADTVTVYVTNELPGTLTLSFGEHAVTLPPGQTWSEQLQGGSYEVFASTNVPEALAFSGEVLLLKGYEYTWVLRRPG
jgi:sugar lactone lactonase YvrE